MGAISGINSTILVTGATGFVGTWIVKVLLERGYRVRCAVRNEGKQHYIRNLYNQYNDRLEFVEVRDISDTGAFDEAVKDVIGIIHTASPVHLTAEEPEEIIMPAVNGTTGILESALKNGSHLRRIVITSSCAAILAHSEVPVTVSERDWNTATVDECHEKGRDAAPLSKYSASKVLAEQAVWDFFEKHKTGITWDITVLNPPWIFGPTVHEVPDFNVINPSWKQWFRAVTKGAFPGQGPELQLTCPGHGWVDVRDVAEAHVRSLEITEAGQERIIVCAGPFVWQDWVTAAVSLEPPIDFYSFAESVPGVARRAISFDTSKEKRILSLEYRSMQELTKDSLDNYRARGWQI